MAQKILEHDPDDEYISEKIEILQSSRNGELSDSSTWKSSRAKGPCSVDGRKGRVAEDRLGPLRSDGEGRRSDRESRRPGHRGGSELSDAGSVRSVTVPLDRGGNDSDVSTKQGRRNRGPAEKGDAMCCCFERSGGR